MERNFVVLTNEQELQVLKALKREQFNCEYCLGRGAARVVFGADKYITKLLKSFGMNFDGKVVIKVCFGSAGFLQMQNEIKFYTEFGKDYPLAAIYGYGKFIEVMARVEEISCTYRDIADEAMDCCCDEEEFFRLMNDLPEDYEDNLDRYSIDYDRNETAEVWDCLWSLNDLVGQTSDNAQLGYDCYGNLVAFDYGYTLGSTGLCSDYSNELCDDYRRIDYIQICIDSIDTISNIENDISLLTQAYSLLESNFSDMNCDDEDSDGLGW